MSYPDITELSNAYTLCLCPEGGCSRACTVCSSVTWAKGPCVKLRWAEHAASDAGKAAAQRFNETLREQGRGEPGPGDTIPLGDVTNMPTVVAQFPLDDVTNMPTVVAQFLDQTTPPSDAEIVERTIDFAEALGMYLEPWQAAALRAILLHGGDVAIGVRY